MILTDLNSLPISNRTNQPTHASRIEVKCDSCGHEYTSSWGNRKKGFDKYNEDLCRSCRQVVQYSLGLRESQRASIIDRNLKSAGMSWEDLYGNDKSVEMKSNLTEKLSGDSNPRWGSKHRTKEEIASQKLLAADQIRSRLAGKTWEELYGKERAGDLKINASLKSSGSNNPMFGKPSPKGAGRGWSGYYHNHYFRSLLELSYLIFLIEQDILFESGELKKYGIDYEFEGKVKTYFPDFYLIESNTAIEVKPKSLIYSKQNVAKFEAAEKSFRKFVIVTEDDFDKIKINQLKTLVECQHITLDHKSQIKYEQLK